MRSGERIMGLFNELAQVYTAAGVVSGVEYWSSADLLDAYFVLEGEPGKAIRIQGIPSRCTDEGALLKGSLVDYYKLNMNMKRKLADCGDLATIRKFRTFGEGALVPYDVRQLEKRIEENHPLITSRQLRDKRVAV